MVPIIDKIANKNNYGSVRAVSNIKYIVIHYTGNDGDSALSNSNYFQNKIVKASAHYFVDDKYIYRSVPENYSAYSVGGKKYNNAGGRLYGTVNNSNSISIELCDAVKNGVVYPTQDTINHAIELVQCLMAKYNIPAHRVIRHYDVNGKECPKYWINDTKWQTEFWNKIGGYVPTSGQDVNPYKEPTKQITSKAVAQQKGVSVFESSGEGVKWVQWELEQVNTGFKDYLEANGGIDGSCGNATVTLIKLFQKAYGLVEDGVCGRKTREALKAN